MPRTLRFATFNTQNLHIKIEENVGRRSRGEDHVSKTFEQIRRLAAAIRSAQADILVLQEVHSVEDLKLLNEHHFDGAYRIVFHRGNDRRGYEIAFLIRKSLPIKFEYESHRDVQWRDPKTGKTIPVFSRDAPAIILMRPGMESPHAILIGHHAKSRVGNRFDHEGVRMRTAQHEALSDIVRKYQAKYGPVAPILVAGDFNTDIHSSEDTEAIRSVATDTFDLSPYPLKAEERCTHTTFAENHYGEHCQLDGILVANGSKLKVLRAGVRRDYPRLPRTPRERDRQASDHLLVYADIEF